MTLLRSSSGNEQAWLCLDSASPAKDLIVLDLERPGKGSPCGGVRQISWIECERGKCLRRARSLQRRAAANIATSGCLLPTVAAFATGQGSFPASTWCAGRFGCYSADP